MTAVQAPPDNVAMYDELVFNDGDFALFKMRLAEAQSEGKNQFMFKGHTFLNDYAKYMIEYLTSIGYGE